MNTYVSDKEQIEMIRNWWRENGKFTLLSIVAALVITSGWRYWQNSKNQEAANASVVYEQMLNHAASHQLSAVQFEVTNLLTSYPHTPYASLAAFMSAQNAVSNNKIDEALEKLNWVISNSKNKDFKQIAKIRKARILLSLKKYDEALSLLTEISSAAYLPLMYEVKGDVLVAKGDKKAALSAYQLALSSLKKDEPNRSFLRMKYDQLSS